MQVETEYCDFNIQKLKISCREKLPPNLQISLNKIAQNEGYVRSNIISRKISTEGGNYMATLYEINIKGETSEGEKETNIFVKCIIPSENVKLIDVKDLYSKELFFYNELSKVFKELQCESGVHLNEMYKIIDSYSESDTEAIILKNVAKEGFTTMDRMNVMPLKFAEMSVQQLAKFHSLSFVLEQKKPQYFERKIKTLGPSIRFDDHFKSFCKNMFNSAVKKLDFEIKSKLNGLLPNLFDDYVQYLSGNKTQVKCLCHGDYRMNNILMKVTKNEITEVIPVDYQLLYYGSPLVDFIYLIFLGNTDKQFRRNNLDNLKNIYYETMDNYLKYFEIDVSTVYPKKEFENDYYQCLNYGLHVTLFVMPFLLIHEDNVPNFDENNILNMKFNHDNRFYDRFKDAIDDMIEWGIL